MTIVLAMTVARTFCQSHAPSEIAGTVVDDSNGAPLENVNVFLVQTTLGGNTNAAGAFEIRNIPNGTYNIVASRLGYEVFKIRLALTPGQRTLKFRLKPATIPLEEVTVSATVPDKWLKQLDRFRKLFFGTTPNAAHCRIVNPEVLEFAEEGSEFFAATAHAPLQIVNDALGYRITFLLSMFRTDLATVTFEGSTGRGSALVYDGYPKYAQIDSCTPEQKIVWTKNRLSTYEGSFRHFLTSLYKGSWNKDGYSIRQMSKPDLHNTPRIRKVLTPKTIDRILSEADSSGDKTLRYEGALEVEYAGKHLENPEGLLRKEFTESPVSWLELNQPSISFNAQGLVIDRLPTSTYGYWTWLRFADTLPLDYEPGN